MVPKSDRVGAFSEHLAYGLSVRFTNGATLI